MNILEALRYRGVWEYLLKLSRIRNFMKNLFKAVTKICFSV